jgi:hypothetical protein
LCTQDISHPSQNRNFPLSWGMRFSRRWIFVSLSCVMSGWTLTSPWRWRQQISPKCWCISTIYTVLRPRRPWLYFFRNPPRN